MRTIRRTCAEMQVELCSSCCVLALFLFFDMVAQLDDRARGSFPRCAFFSSL